MSAYNSAIEMSATMSATLTVDDFFDVGDECRRHLSASVNMRNEPPRNLFC